MWPMTYLGNIMLEWVDRIKYPGITFLSLQRESKLVILDVNFIHVMVYLAIVAQWTNLSSLVLLNPFVYH